MTPEEMKKKLITIRRMIATAETYLTKADREYAYFKNKQFGDENLHYLNSQNYYRMVRDKLDYAARMIEEYQVNDPFILARYAEVEQKLQKNR